MNLWNALIRRRGAARPQHASSPAHWLDVERPGPDLKRLLLLIGLGGLSWVATYVGMLELIQANLGDLPLTHKVIIGFSCAMLMTMIVWLLDNMFAPVSFGTRLCYIAGYLFLSIISVGFGFGFYWKVLESHGVASRSAESAITQVQGELFGASTRLEQLQSTLDQLTTVSTEKADKERTSGRHLSQQRAGRRAAPQDARRRRGALQVCVRLRQGPHRHGQKRHDRARRRAAKDRHEGPLDHRSADRHTATNFCASWGASSTSRRLASTPFAATRS